MRGVATQRDRQQGQLLPYRQIISNRPDGGPFLSSVESQKYNARALGAAKLRLQGACTGPFKKFRKAEAPHNPMSGLKHMATRERTSQSTQSTSEYRKLALTVG